MELDNKKLTNLVIVMLIVCILHIGFTVWSYRLLRNKEGVMVVLDRRGPRGIPGR